MSSKHSKWARRARLPKVKGGALAHTTLNELGWYSDDKGRCYPSVQTITENIGHIGQSKRQVERALTALENLGVIIRTRTPGRVTHTALNTAVDPVVGWDLKQHSPRWVRMPTREEYEAFMGWLADVDPRLCVGSRISTYTSLPPSICRWCKVNHRLFVGTPPSICRYTTVYLSDEQEITEGEQENRALIGVSEGVDVTREEVTDDAGATPTVGDGPSDGLQHGQQRIEAVRTTPQTGRVDWVESEEAHRQVLDGASFGLSSRGDEQGVDVDDAAAAGATRLEAVDGVAHDVERLNTSDTSRHRRGWGDATEQGRPQAVDGSSLNLSSRGKAQGVDVDGTTQRMADHTVEVLGAGARRRTQTMGKAKVSALRQPAQEDTGGVGGHQGRTQNQGRVDEPTSNPSEAGATAVDAQEPCGYQGRAQGEGRENQGGTQNSWEWSTQDHGERVDEPEGKAHTVGAGGSELQGPTGLSDFASGESAARRSARSRALKGSGETQQGSEGDRTTRGAVSRANRLEALRGSNPPQGLASPAQTPQIDAEAPLSALEAVRQRVRDRVRGGASVGRGANGQNLGAGKPLELSPLPPGQRQEEGQTEKSSHPPQPRSLAGGHPSGTPTQTVEQSATPAGVSRRMTSDPLSGRFDWLKDSGRGLELEGVSDDASRGGGHAGAQEGAGVPGCLDSGAGGMHGQHQKSNQDSIQGEGASTKSPVVAGGFGSDAWRTQATTGGTVDDSRNGTWDESAALVGVPSDDEHSAVDGVQGHSHRPNQTLSCVEAVGGGGVVLGVGAVRVGAVADGAGATPADVQGVRDDGRASGGILGTPHQTLEGGHQEQDRPLFDGGCGALGDAAPRSDREVKPIRGPLLSGGVSISSGRVGPPSMGAEREAGAQGRAQASNQRGVSGDRSGGVEVERWSGVNAEIQRRAEAGVAGHPTDGPAALFELADVANQDTPKEKVGRVQHHPAMGDTGHADTRGVGAQASSQRGVSDVESGHNSQYEAGALGQTPRGLRPIGSIRHKQEVAQDVRIMGSAGGARVGAQASSQERYDAVCEAIASKFPRGYVLDRAEHRELEDLCRTVGTGEVMRALAEAGALSYTPVRWVTARVNERAARKQGRREGKPRGSARIDPRNDARFAAMVESWSSGISA